MTTRLELDADDVGQGLGRLVVAVLDLVRQLLEREALRRVDDGSLGPEQIERLGLALLGLEQRLAELREMFVQEDAAGGARALEVLSIEPATETRSAC
ncbi:MAG: gas vesicle protein K [Kofleriaceae bacterium]